MNVLSNIIAGAVRVALLPVAVAADCITMCGALTDTDESYTISATKHIIKNVSKTIHELEANQ